MTEKEQAVHDEAINLAAMAIKQALKDKIQQYPEDFAPVLTKPNAIKTLAGEAIRVLLDKAEADSKNSDKGGALLMAMGASFLILNIEAITNKVVEIYSVENN